MALCSVEEAVADIREGRNAFNMAGCSAPPNSNAARREENLKYNFLKMIESGANGIVAMLAATHNRLDLLKALLADELFNVTMSIFARDDDDRRDGFGILEGGNGVCDDRFAVNFGKEFIETHATAAARRHDNRAKHGEDVEAVKR